MRPLKLFSKGLRGPEMVLYGLIERAEALMKPLRSLLEPSGASWGLLEPPGTSWSLLNLPGNFWGLLEPLGTS